MPTNNNENKNQVNYIPVGMALGAGIGTSIGVATDNLAVGVALGAGIGMLLGTLLQQRMNNNKNGE